MSSRQRDKKIKVHIVGTHGVPARYGGFETLADFLCQNLNTDFDITVYCNSKIYPDKIEKYHGSKLKYIKLDASGVQGIVYDFITYINALYKADVIIYLSPVGSGFMTPVRKLFRTKVITNHGGLNEWEREKLSWFQKKWAKFNHRIAARYSTLNIADNEQYKQSLKDNFGAESTVIRYGGDHVNANLDKNKFIKKYPFVNEKYAVSVSRAQLDNNLHIVLECFEKFDHFKLVLISNWSVSNYGRELKEKYKAHPNMILLDAVYDKEELDYLRSNAYVYVHSHSRCGTAPSLVEAMCLGQAVISYDVATNRETMNNLGQYFKNSQELTQHLSCLHDEEISDLAQKLKSLACQNYSWKYISQQYRELINSYY